MSEAIFSHSGKVGDLIYALPFALAYVRMYNIKRTAFNLNVLPGRRLYTRESAEALAALLRSQHWVDAVWFDRPEEATVNLDAGNHTWVRHNSGDLARRFALLGREFPEPIDFTAPWLFGIEPDPRAKGRIVLFRSLRYRNDRLNYLSLLRWRDRLLFLGSPEEYDEFASRTFQCDYLPTGDFFRSGPPDPRRGADDRQPDRPLRHCRGAEGAAAAGDQSDLPQRHHAGRLEPGSALRRGSRSGASAPGLNRRNFSGLS
ncbi:MAG: hypothetical protein L6W00_08055 [Lentisphaeria bacterium]|nr:MAG: hypothetical protein L6W00_08055 [Lentisphaeria bacterium]